MTPPRIMPARWFVGSAGARQLLYLFEGDLYDRPLAEGERQLGPFILPPFQRPPVWAIGQKRLLIESIYAGLPIGALVVNATRNGQRCDGWLLDGQQRVTTMLEYTRGDFIVCGWYYPDLPEIEQRHFRRMTVGVIETNETDPDRCREIYRRVAYGGTAHE